MVDKKPGLLLIFICLFGPTFCNICNDSKTSATFFLDLLSVIPKLSLIILIISSLLIPSFNKSMIYDSIASLSLKLLTRLKRILISSFKLPCSILNIEVKQEFILLRLIVLTIGR